MKDAQCKCDSQARFFLLDKILMRWSSIHVNITASMFILLLTILGTSLRRVLDTNLLALAFVYSLQLMGMTSWTVMSLVQLENELTSVERVQELLTIEDEEELRLRKNGKLVEKTIVPNSGSIEIINLSLRYRENLPIILHNLNVKIKDGEKIGIVGRTGSGKSSIMRAILYLFETLQDGDIILGGVNCKTIPLKLLRGEIISIIPQEPVVFAGTVRENLDPNYSGIEDDVLWRALSDVNLKSKFEARDGLDFYVGEDGTELSHGERQLLVICRALVKPCRILLVDEATSSVDGKTDAIIQKIIRERFKDKTVLTIAHRLDTIMDSDRIIVMEDGVLKEFDKPDTLLKNEQSLFSNMVKKNDKSKTTNMLNEV